MAPVSKKSTSATDMDAIVRVQAPVKRSAAPLPKVKEAPHIEYTRTGLAIVTRPRVEAPEAPKKENKALSKIVLNAQRGIQQLGQPKPAVPTRTKKLSLSSAPSQKVEISQPAPVMMSAIRPRKVDPEVPIPQPVTVPTTPAVEESKIPRLVRPASPAPFLDLHKKTIADHIKFLQSLAPVLPKLELTEHIDMLSIPSVAAPEAKKEEVNAKPEEEIDELSVLPTEFPAADMLSPVIVISNADEEDNKTLVQTVEAPVEEKKQEQNSPVVTLTAVAPVEEPVVAGPALFTGLSAAPATLTPPVAMEVVAAPTEQSVTPNTVPTGTATDKIVKRKSLVETLRSMGTPPGSLSSIPTIVQPAHSSPKNPLKRTTFLSTASPVPLRAATPKTPGRAARTRGPLPVRIPKPVVSEGAGDTLTVTSPRNVVDSAPAAMQSMVEEGIEQSWSSKEGTETQESFMQSVLKYLTTGRTKMWRTNGTASFPRFFFLSPNHENLLWAKSLPSVFGEGSNCLRNVKKFILRPQNSGPDFKLGFTLVWYDEDMDVDRHIELIASTSVDWEAWVLGLSYLLARQEQPIFPTYGEPGKYARDTMFTELNDREREFCAKYHVAPTDYLVVEAKLMAENNTLSKQSATFARGKWVAGYVDLIQARAIVSFLMSGKKIIPNSVV